MSRVQPGWKLWLSMLGMCALSVLVSYLLAENARINAERKLCEALRSDLHAYVIAPPTTDAGRAQRDSKVAILETQCADEKE